MGGSQVTALMAGTGRAVEVLHDRGAHPAANRERWTTGSGYLIGGRMVLTAAHNIDYQQRVSDGEQLLVRTMSGAEFTAGVMLVCDEASQVDLALLEVTDDDFHEHLTSIAFASVNRDSPVPLADCWAVGFPRLAESRSVLLDGSRSDSWHVHGTVLPGGKRRSGLLALEVTSTPRPLPGSPAGSPWDGMSGAAVFAAVPSGGRAIGVVSVHHRPEGASALAVTPITELARRPDAGRWWQLLGTDLHMLSVLPPLSRAEEETSRLAGSQALAEHWDPRARGVEHHDRPGWFFTGRRQALRDLVAWLSAPPDPADNVRLVTGGPGSGKSALLARLVTMSDPAYRARMPRPMTADDAVADLPESIIDIAVHARAASTEGVMSVLAAAVGALRPNLDSLIGALLQRQRQLTIVIDAVDEADDPSGLVLMLRQLASGAADAGVRLLAGARPGGPDRRLITGLGLLGHDNPAVIDLDLPAFVSHGDIAEYVRLRLLLVGVIPGPGQPDTPYRGQELHARQIADAVAAEAYPSFLIGQLVSRALLLRTEPLSPDNVSEEWFPKTASEAMDLYLAGAGDQEQRSRTEDILRPLAYARGDGLPLDDAGLWPRLATALARPGRSYTVRDASAVLDTAAADFLIETVRTGQATYYRLYHQALVRQPHLVS